MNDGELLELAAKAAGFELLPCTCSKGVFKAAHLGRDITHWSPLENDGDAFRLAVKLSINVSFASIPTFGDIYAQAPDVPPVFEHVGGDVYAATRRAIVISAANIGRNMK